MDFLETLHCLKYSVLSDVFTDFTKKKFQVHPAKACQKKSAELEAEVIFIRGQRIQLLISYPSILGYSYIHYLTNTLDSGILWPLQMERNSLLIFFVPIPISIGIWLAQSTIKVPKDLTHTRSSSDVGILWM
jgi:hypothetical protein